MRSVNLITKARTLRVFAYINVFFLKETKNSGVMQSSAHNQLTVTWEVNRAMDIICWNSSCAPLLVEPECPAKNERAASAASQPTTARAQSRSVVHAIFSAMM
jgi:hypothetical protein